LLLPGARNIFSLVAIDELIVKIRSLRVKRFDSFDFYLSSIKTRRPVLG
jgi:hypothetical protein